MTDIRGDINEAFEKAIANIKVRYSFVIIMILVCSDVFIHWRFG